MKVLVKKHDPKHASKISFFYFDSDVVRKLKFKAKLLYNIWIQHNFIARQFITLTYSPTHYVTQYAELHFGRKGFYLKETEGIFPGEDWRIFMNRLKSYCRKNKIDTPQFVRVAEHGAKNGRVHIHAMLSKKFTKEQYLNWWGKCEKQALDVEVLDDTSDTQKLSSYLTKYFTKQYKHTKTETETEQDKNEKPVYKPYLDRKFYTWIRGQSMSCSRNFQKMPVGKVLKFNKQYVDNLHTKFNLVYYLDDSKYKDHTTLTVCNEENSILQDFKSNYDEIMCFMHNDSFKMLQDDMKHLEKSLEKRKPKITLKPASMTKVIRTSITYDPHQHRWVSGDYTGYIIKPEQYVLLRNTVVKVKKLN